MRKFKHPFDSYEIGKIKPMAIETDRAGVGKYFNRYRDNAIYYENSLKYLGGELYRAILGYDLVWDKKTERNLMLCLDYLMTRYQERDEYYFEELIVTKEVMIHGVTWHRGIAPKKLAFELQWPHQLKPGQRITARVNCLDKPNHVDLELPDGTVFTLQLIKYLRYRETVLKGTKGYERPRRQKTTSSFTSPKGTGLSLVTKYGNKKPARKISLKLLGLRKTI